MKGFAKTIATGQDIYNCLAMVQAGTLAARDLRGAIESIEARGFIHCPILETSADRKTVTINYCAEAKAGQTVNGVNVAAVQHSHNAARGEGGTGGDTSPTDTVLTLKTALAAGVAVVAVPSPISPFAEMGITAAQLTEIEEVLKNYE